MWDRTFILSVFIYKVHGKYILKYIYIILSKLKYPAYSTNALRCGCIYAALRARIILSWYRCCMEFTFSIEVLPPICCIYIGSPAHALANRRCGNYIGMKDVRKCLVIIYLVYKVVFLVKTLPLLVSQPAYSTPALIWRHQRLRPSLYHINFTL